MSGRRVVALYALLVGCFAAVVYRLYWLCSNPAYAARAAAQSVVTLRLPARRGNFYDCDGHLLTGLGTKWEALCVPGEGNYTRLFFLYRCSRTGLALPETKRACSVFP